MNQSDIATLKRVLQFLLIIVKTSFDTSYLLTLLSLDWVNTELNLDLEFESLWKTKLISSNIIVLLCECFINTFLNVQVNLKEVEDLVISAMHYIELHNEQQLMRQVRLHEIVNRVLESDCMLNWVSVYEDSIAHVFAFNFDELLLNCCQCKNDCLQQD